ncbi:MAG: chorismate synthase [Acidobacteria bacterium]|nr:MAG: chorismate synthase [Acidobacteriota bacterium]REK01225.1 MAG: chorismate synthase [Acidobacteriota bacterium]REK14181.1 MAG: chorismate synthase [Acidobacteriota bacterium]REK44896.1 MAG: chorismate synthase [Acidobacteriota bacterium]
MNFRFTTAGESHGKALIALVEGVPAGLAIDKGTIDFELARRQLGYGRGGRMKIESDRVEILSGIRHGKAIGSPIAMMIENRDFVHWTEVMSSEIPESPPKNERVVKRPRPGHADLAGGQKFEARDLRNILERASARETAARVACGAIARILLSEFRIEIRSHVAKLGDIPKRPIDAGWEEISSISNEAPLRCTDPEIEKEMVKAVDRAKESGDTLGGVFEVAVKGIPPGIGSHTSWYEKLDGRLARAVMSIPAVKAVEIGTGVENSGLRGSAVHDEITFDNGEFGRSTNRAGGLEGGITNGQELRVRGYKKPISTLRKPLRSVDIDTKEVDEAAFERSDITAVPAAGVIGEAMVALVLADAIREKFGGDSISEMRRNFEGYIAQLRDY